MDAEHDVKIPGRGPDDPMLPLTNYVFEYHPADEPLIVDRNAEEFKKQVLEAVDADLNDKVRETERMCPGFAPIDIDDFIVDRNAGCKEIGSPLPTEKSDDGTGRTGPDGG